MGRVARVIALLMLCWGCNESGETQSEADVVPDSAPDTGTTTTYYRDIKPLVDAYCVRCHQDGGIAPFALGRYEEVQAMGAVIANVTAKRQMPPFLADPGVRAYLYDPSLSDDQIALIADWVSDGLPQGDPGDEGPSIALALGALSREDITLEMPSAYTPQGGLDDYRCFVLDWPFETQQWITGFNLKPGNLLVAHHGAAYLIDPGAVALVEAADGADGRPGYGCFGGATPPEVESFPTKILATWVPGAQGYDFPQGTGIPVEPGSKIVLQLHYSTLVAGPQSDRSMVAFRLDEGASLTPGGNLPWLNIAWTADGAMTIPAGEAAVVHEFVSDPTKAALLPLFIPGLDASQGLRIHSILPHMHKLGARIRLQIERADGGVEPLIEIPAWDFDWQRDYLLKDSVVVNPGDKLRIRCEWDNTAGSQPVVDGVQQEPRDVTWGEGTFDEMCVASLYVSKP